MTYVEAATEGTAVPPFEEDRARANFYALIARLFHAGPDAQLLGLIARADEVNGAAESAPVSAAWRALGAAAGATDAQAVRQEYDSVFVGTGMAEITPYASHYSAQSMKERVLIRLRRDLAQMGLARHRSAAEYEDHFSGLCEVMRYLIALGSGDAALHRQKLFFSNYLAPCYAEFCSAVAASPNTNFYKSVGFFTKAFLDVEAKSFEMI